MKMFVAVSALALSLAGSEFSRNKEFCWHWDARDPRKGVKARLSTKGRLF